MLSAREKLYISYVGQDIGDNTPIQPSALVSELMDYVESGFELQGVSILDHILTKHRLQAFSSEYFKRGRLFSYSEENCRIALALAENRRETVPFFSRGLSEPEEAWKTVQLEDLCRFFSNPSRYLLERRLGLHFEERSIVLDEREPFAIKGLDRYLLENDLLRKELSGFDLKAYLRLVKASGQLPHGTVGDCIYEDLIQGVMGFAETLISLRTAGELDPLNVDLSIAGFKVTGKISGIYPEMIIPYRYARIRPKDFLDAWICHLALNCVSARGYPRTTFLLGLDPEKEGRGWSAFQYGPVEESQEILRRMLEKYWAGLKMPLPLFPDSSWAYASERLTKSRSPADSLERARKTWEGEYSRGEGEDPYYRICFRGGDPLGSAFVRIAEEIFGPLLEHMEKIQWATREKARMLHPEGRG